MMTPDERAALVEKVANAMWEADPYYASRDLAAIAIDLIRAETLEEAARVAEQHPDASTATRRDWTICIGPDIAAAIRNPKGDT